MKKLKVSDIILIAVIAIIVIGGILVSLFSSDKDEKTSYNLPLVVEGEAGLKLINYSEYNEKIESEKPFVVIIERATCSYCQLYLPIVEEVASEKGLPIYYIDTDTLSEEEVTKLSTSNDYLKTEEWGTPTTLLLKGTEAVANISGYVEKDSLVEWLDKNVTKESE